MSQRDAVLQQHQAVREALLPFTRGRVYGGVLDGDQEALSERAVQGFALEALIKLPQVLEPTVSYLWHWLFRHFDGRPTLVSMDEVSFALKLPSVYRQIDEDLRLLRERGVSLLLATQNPLDVIDSGIGPLLLDNCVTRILGPNSEATDPAIRPAYEALGLHADLITQLAQAPAKQSYLWCQGEHKRLVTIRLAPVAQAICGSSSPADHQLIADVLATKGDEPFVEAWLRAKGLKEGDDARVVAAAAQ